MLARMVTCPPTRGKGAPRVAMTRSASSGRRAVQIGVFGQDREAAVAAGQGVADAVVEQRPVGQVGEAVVERLVLELGGEGVALAERGPEHALGAAQLAHGRLVLADQAGHPGQHQQEQQPAAGHDHRDVEALVAERLDGEDGRGHQRRPARLASRAWVSPVRGAGTGSVRVATEGSSTAAPHRA